MSLFFLMLYEHGNFLSLRFFSWEVVENTVLSSRVGVSIGIDYHVRPGNPSLSGCVCCI
jgi:hypothetical protein